MDTLVVLAGGEARRLPHKLERVVNGEPMILGAVRRFSSAFNVAVSLAAPLPDDIARCLDCTVIYDRYAKRGPLGGMLSACEVLECKRLGFVAADLPFADAPLLVSLRQAWRDADEAVVASHGGFIEPLVGWYDRLALLREGNIALKHEDAAVHRVVEHLRARTMPMASEAFVNINTPEDLRALTSS